MKDLNFVDKEALAKEVLSNQGKFIESKYDRLNAGLFDWVFSMGTNFTCYNYTMLEKRDDMDHFNKRIDTIRIILYMVQAPLFSKFFYWVLIVFALHKLNFKKPIMKIIGFHYMFHVIGDMLNQANNLLSDYFVNVFNPEKGMLECGTYPGPLSWVIARELAMIFWYSAEIIGDWYPLLRTKAVVKNEKIIWLVYITCGFFNISKVAKVVWYCSRNLRTLYNVDGAYDYEREGKFMVVSDIMDMVILAAAVFYDIAVYIVLKKCIFSKNNYYNFGFLKKFKNLSEYRILLSSLISLVFLPFLFAAQAIRFYYLHNYNGAYKLNFSSEDARVFVTHVQYFMIYIDQIFLTCFKNESTNSSSNNNSGSNVYKNNSKSFSDSKMKFPSQLNNSSTFVNSPDEPSYKYEPIIKFNLNNNDYKINSSSVSKRYYDNLANNNNSKYSSNNINNYNYNKLDYNSSFNYDNYEDRNYDKYPFNYDNKNY